MIPIYGIILRRVEYLIIWRDNNFDKSLPLTIMKIMKLCLNLTKK